MNVGAQGADVGMIPTIAVKRLEVLRDGAAAQYGSDAIAGVMNFILKDNNSGYEVHVTGGQWMQSPNGRGGETDLTLAANIGLPLTDDGFINLSFEYADRQARGSFPFFSKIFLIVIPCIFGFQFIKFFLDFSPF